MTKTIRFVKPFIAFILIALAIAVIFTTASVLSPKDNPEVSIANLATEVRTSGVSEPNLSNLTSKDFEYILELGKDYLAENPAATEDEVDDYLKRKMIYLSENKPPFATLGLYDDLTEAEKALIIAHPFKALTVNSCKDKAEAKTVEFFKAGNNGGDSGDAFRHGYWNALMTVKMDAYWAEQFATAHESEAPEGLDKEMDLTNNIRGRDTGTRYSSFNDNRLATKVLTEVASGLYKKIVENKLVQTSWEEIHENFIFTTTCETSDTIAIADIAFNAPKDFIIPDTIKGKRVIEIFAGAFENDESLVFVTIPASVEVISDSAFRGSTVTGVTLAEGSRLKRIEASAFENSNCLNVLNIPDSLMYIRENAFKNSGVYLFSSNNNVVTIDNDKWVVGVKGEINGAISLSANTVGIADYAFREGATRATSITLPNNLSKIGLSAFSGCYNLSAYTSRSSKLLNWSDIPSNVIWNCNITENRVISFNKSNNFAANPGASGYTFDGWYTNSNFTGNLYDSVSSAPNGILYAKWTKKTSCIAEGTLITLADGTQKAVEQLDGSEMLLVWNMLTGQFDTAPILFIDSDPASEYEIIKLRFSDGTEVKVISEHGFWDFDLNKYVMLDNTAAQYIGHWFNKQTTDAEGNLTWERVQLTDVDIYTDYTTSWSPVTYGHLCYYVGGMLSMPGGVTGLINIFEVDAETLTVDQEAYEADVEQYGLFTYEEFAEIFPIPELIYEAFGGQYLKISIGKGLITPEQIGALIERYAEFFG